MHSVNPPFAVAKAVFEASFCKQPDAGRAAERTPQSELWEPALVQVSNSACGADRSNARPGVGSRAAVGEDVAASSRTPTDDLAGQLQDAYNRGCHEGERVGYWKGRYDEQKVLNGQLRQELDDQRQCFKAYRQVAKQQFEAALYELNCDRDEQEYAAWRAGIGYGRASVPPGPIGNVLRVPCGGLTTDWKVE